MRHPFPSADGNSRREIMRMLAIGRTAVQGLDRFWKDHNFAICSMAPVFHVAKYGYETQNLSSANKQKYD